jgi:hypothetical protein
MTAELPPMPALVADCTPVVAGPADVPVLREVEASGCTPLDPLELPLSGASAPELHASAGASPQKRAM